MSKSFKEMQFRPNIAEHDLGYKLKQILRFLEKGLQVRIVISMSGRENMYRDKAIALLDRLAQETALVGKMDPRRTLNANKYFATISPTRK